MVLLEGFHNGLDFGLGVVNFVGGDGLGVVAVDLDDGGSGFFGSHEALVDQLHFLLGLLLQEHLPEFLVVLLADHEDLLDILTFLNLNAFDLSLAERWLHLVEVIEHLLGLHILADGFLGDHTDHRFFRLFDFLEFFAEDFLDFFDFNGFGLSGVSSFNSVPEFLDLVIDDKFVLSLGNRLDLHYFNFISVEVLTHKCFLVDLFEVIFVLDGLNLFAVFKVDLNLFHVCLFFFPEDVGLVLFADHDGYDQSFISNENALDLVGSTILLEGHTLEVSSVEFKTHLF